MTPGISIVEHSTTKQNHRLYTVDFFGTDITVTVTSSATAARKWLGSILYFRRRIIRNLVVGVGVQWNPSNGNDPPADTLQLCVGTRCLIFQLSRANKVPALLRRFLLNEDITFVGIWNGSDEKKLWMTDHDLEIHKLLDLRRYVETDDGESLDRASVEEIVEECLGFKGVRLDKYISMSDWDDYHLSDDQVLQACVKAYVAFEIGVTYSAWSF